MGNEDDRIKTQFRGGGSKSAICEKILGSTKLDKKEKYKKRGGGNWGREEEKYDIKKR